MCEPVRRRWPLVAGGLAVKALVADNLAHGFGAMMCDTLRSRALVRSSSP